MANEPSGFYQKNASLGFGLVLTGLFAFAVIYISYFNLLRFDSQLVEVAQSSFASITGWFSFLSFATVLGGVGLIFYGLYQENKENETTREMDAQDEQHKRIVRTRVVDIYLEYFRTTQAKCEQLIKLIEESGGQFPEGSKDLQELDALKNELKATLKKLGLSGLDSTFHNEAKALHELLLGGYGSEKPEAEEKTKE